MARIEKGRYVPNKSVLVKQGTVDEMKKMGMKAALDRANSGTASDEQVEAARRFYGSRVTGKPGRKPGGPQMSHKAESAVSGEAVAVPSKTTSTVRTYKNQKPSDPDFQKPFGKNESAI